MSRSALVGGDGLVRSRDRAPDRRRDDTGGQPRHAAGPTPRQFWVLAAGVAAAVAVFVVWVHFEIGGPTTTSWFNNLTEIAAAFAAALACRWAAQRRPDTRRAWNWLAAACAAWGVGQCTWSWYELRIRDVPSLSLADLGYLLFVPFAVIGVLSFPSAPHRSLTRYQGLLDGLIIAASLLFVSWATTLGAAVETSSGTRVAQVVNLAYPVTDIVLATTVFATLSMARGRWRIALALLGAGLILFALADSSFAYLNATDSYGLGNAADAGWVAGFLLIALAAALPTPDGAVHHDRDEPTRAQLVVPYVPLSLAVLTGVLVIVVGDGLDTALQVTAVVIAGLVVVRQLVALVEAADLRRAVVERNKELADRDTRQRLILTGAADGIVGVDERGTIEFANPAALAMLDRTADEVVGAALHDVVHARPCDGPDCHLASGLATNPPRSGAVDDFVRADGRTFPAEYSCTPFGDDAPNAGAVLVFRDISERRAVERMKDEFLSIVSHELRTPLTSVRGSLGLLGSGVAGELSSKASRMVDIAVDNTDRLIRLINDILDMERMTSGSIPLDRETCDAAPLITKAARVVTPMANTAGVTIEVGPTDGRVWADPDRIVQALTNLMANAVKFSARDQVVGVRSVVDGSAVRFEVVDAGRGIPADKLGQIFDRFQQVDASDARDKGGAGLGLAITKSIVEQHGGRVRVASTEGVGSTFSFDIPRAG